MEVKDEDKYAIVAEIEKEVCRTNKSARAAWEGYGIHVVREPQLPFPKPAISNPSDIYGLWKRQLAYQDREIFATVILDARHQVLGINTVSIGSLSASIVHPRETFKPAVLMGASSIILAHNHPSGDPAPSQDEIDLTHRLHKVGRHIDAGLVGTSMALGLRRPRWVGLCSISKLIFPDTDVEVYYLPAI